MDFSTTKHSSNSICSKKLYAERTTRVVFRQKEGMDRTRVPFLPWKSFFMAETIAGHFLSYHFLRKEGHNQGAFLVFLVISLFEHVESTMLN